MEILCVDSEGHELERLSIQLHKGLETLRISAHFFQVWPSLWKDMVVNIHFDTCHESGSNSSLAEQQFTSVFGQWRRVLGGLSGIL